MGKTKKYIKLWRVDLNWMGEIHKFYTHARCSHKALWNVSKQLKKRGVPYVTSYIHNKIVCGDVDYAIKEVKKDDETF